MDMKSSRSVHGLALGVLDAAHGRHQATHGTMVEHRDARVGVIEYSTCCAVITPLLHFCTCMKVGAVRTDLSSE